MSPVAASDWAKLARLKRLRERHAEAELATARATERTLDAEAAALQRRVLGEQGGWLRAMEAEPADLGGAALWGRAIAEGEAGLRRLKPEQEQARAAAAAAQAQLAQSRAQAELTQDLWRMARRREAQAAEARALADVDDLIAARRRP